MRTVVSLAVISLVVSCATVAPDGPDGEPQFLYTGAQVDLLAAGDEPVPGRRRLERELEQGLQPVPNTTWLGVLRPGLWVYRLTGDPEDPGLRRWAADRFAEQPVLFRDDLPQQGVASLQSRLFNRGYFDAEITYSIRQRDSRVAVEYEISVDTPYRIGAVQYPDGDTPLHQTLQQAAADSLLQPGQPYRLQSLREERARLDRHLKEHGFFAFNPAFLIFEADVDTEQRLVDLELVIEAPAGALQQYRVESIAIYADYSPERSLEQDPTHQLGDKIRYYERFPRFDPEKILSSLLFRPGDQYSRSRHVHSIQRLMSMDVFQFVNIRYEQNHEDGTLHAQVLLTPSASRSLEGEVRAVTRSDGFAGPGFSAAWTNRNLGGGAERLRVESGAALETSLTGGSFSADSYELQLDASVSVPRIVGPLRVLGWIDRHGEQPQLPQSSIRVGISRQGRFEQYHVDQAEASLSYTWGDDLERELRPLELTAVRVADISADDLRQDWRNQLLAGASYRLQYRRHEGIGRQFSARFDAGADLLDPQPYVRLDTDGRLYLPLGERGILAMRAAAGAGAVVQGDSAIPPVRQFGVGGGSSLRAFPARSIGPGSEPPDDGGERTGELRLESSIEHRFRLLGYLHSALFLDAGNIWMLSGERGRADPARLPGETAIGVGAGLRVDAQVIVLRLDAAVPLRKPWLPEGDRWVAGDIDLADREWRRSNVMYSLAIGYPF
ncbi:autotransporter assembly complex protein TamA [Spirochaeta africana]|uniref:Outer membrane protein/protective antigen OMA87 n=1 Tax=Spirochaeta africana (strain ATCC 700263 / DSM 8902 / Z-7692) TaxID=889378 RepID=H9UL98_SPIAZ|nr:BamA/TamA family outer membrane protein [Spirochaeta africana]AFG38291.1 outer membrane protein/protective antigen OMA87 [Spirochaeta africana DSM 8902]